MSPANLDDNVVNRQLAPHQPKLKPWRSAGLILTYWCPARCACCYVCAGPEAGRPETEMTVEAALTHWRAIRDLAGLAGQVHLTGGEPFGDYPRLRTILQAACDERLGGLEKIETNAFWAADAGLVRGRLSELKALGLTKLQVSTDVYHQEHVPFARVELAIRVGQEVLGPDHVQVRWRDFHAHPVLVANLPPARCRQAFADALAQHPERLLGRAAEQLASLFPSRPYGDFAELNCGRSLLGAAHVHIDGLGNVFAGTCVGIILGRVTTAPGSLAQLWRSLDYRQHPIISPLVAHGPTGLLSLAEPLGFRPQAGYGGKCQLCYELRRFLHLRGGYESWLGPAVCYGLANSPQDPPRCAEVRLTEAEKDSNVSDSDSS